MSNPINPTFNNRAVSVYGSGDALDDFPVLKAFQQYIDAEQAKARKRLLAMGVFFGALMLVVIAIFVVLLVSVSSRNQQLNDRLIEFAMKDRPTGSAVVVQPPQDNTALLTLTTKLEDLQRKLSETQAQADKAVAEAEKKAQQAVEAAKPPEPTAEELEIRRLKAQLAAEKEKAAAERERRREEELEAYRRKHYPELYETKRPATQEVRKTPSRASREVIDQILDELDRIEADTEASSDATDDADDFAPIRYFEDGQGRKSPIQTSPTAKASRTHAPNAAATSHTISVPNGKTSVNWGIPD